MKSRSNYDDLFIQNSYIEQASRCVEEKLMPVGQPDFTIYNTEENSAHTGYYEEADEADESTTHYSTGGDVHIKGLSSDSEC